MIKAKINSCMEKVGNDVSEILRTRPLAVFCVLAFIFVVLRLYVSVEPLLLVILLIGISLIWLNLSGKIDNFITVFICLSMFLALWVSADKIYSTQMLMEKYNNQFVRVEGRIASVPEANSYTTSFYFDCDNLQSNVGEYENLKILVSYKGNVTFKYGDKLTFNAVLYDVEYAKASFSTHFLSKGAPLVANDVIILKKGEAKFPYNVISKLRNSIIDAGNKFFAGDARELFKALTAGDRTGFSEELTKNLSMSGLSHIACVSGLHVSILGMAIYNLLKKKNKYLSAVLSVGVVYLFAVLTGMSPSTLRAAMMFTSFIVAKIALQDNDSFTALSFSAMVLILFNPYVIYDWGFILSFLSVLGIQVFSFYFKSLLSFLPEPMADSVSVTVSAQLMTTPALVNMFGYLSVYSIFANLVVSMMFLLTLYLCFIFVFAAYIPVVNRFVAVICAFLLDTISVVAKFFTDMPMSIVYVNKLNVFEIIIYYVFVLMFMFREKLSWKFIGIMIFLCVAVLLIGAHLPI